MSIREGLLALLAAEPKHGYQLKSEFEAATAGVWPLNVGQVYTTLERLERDGLVSAGEPEADNRRKYHLSPSGREALEDWFSAAHSERPDRDPLMIKVLVAIHTTGVDPIAVIDAQRSSLLATLQEHRRSQRKALGHTENSTNRPSTDEDLTAVLLFDALVARTESELRWLDLCEERLTSTRRNSR